MSRQSVGGSCHEWISWPCLRVRKHTTIELVPDLHIVKVSRLALDNECQSPITSPLPANDPSDQFQFLIQAQNQSC